MAEFHLLGQLQGATDFLESTLLFCRYSFQSGVRPVNWSFSTHHAEQLLFHDFAEKGLLVELLGHNWTIVSGCPEGQTVSGKLNHSNSVIWTHPLDLHYITKGIQGWPKLILQVNCLDSIGRSWMVGYSCCSLPTAPGHHQIQVPCWAPTTNNITDKIRQHFLGGSHQLIQTDIVNLGTDRLKLGTQSKGNINIGIDLVLRNFTQFGVEYK